MTKEMQDIICDNIYNFVIDLINNNVEFTIILDYHKNWEKEFPDRLKNNQHILLNIKEQALEDSFVENNKIYIMIEIDGVTYSKILEPADIFAVQENEKSQIPFMIRPFNVKPTLEMLKTKEKYVMPTDEDLQHSNKMFKKNNPNMFK